MERRAAVQFLASLGAGVIMPPDALEAIFAGIERAAGAHDHVDLDDWEQTVQQYGHMITRRPVGELVDDLTSDILAVGRLLNRGNTPLAQAGLLRVGAGLSALLAIEFGDLDDQRAARLAWRAARRAADASGDRDLSVWVCAREAGDARYVESRSQIAADLADRAVQIAGTAPSYGLMRAHTVRAWLAAKQGDHSTARAALRAFLQTYEKLPEGRPYDDPAAFGLAEAYVRSQEALVYTMIGDAQATAAIERAFAVFPSEASGMAILNLTQAANLVRTGEIDEGVNHALTTLQALPVVTPRGRLFAGSIIRILPDKARELPATQELRALMT